MTKYFWIASFTWPLPGGTVTWDRAATFETDAPVSRAQTLTEIMNLARREGMPEKGVSTVFFTVEPDEVRR